MGKRRWHSSVSKSRLRVTPGVPMVTGTTYSRSTKEQMSKTRHKSKGCVRTLLNVISWDLAPRRAVPASTTTTPGRRTSSSALPSMRLLLLVRAKQTTKEGATLAPCRSVKGIDPAALTTSQQDVVMREENGLVRWLERPLVCRTSVLMTQGRWSTC